MDNRPRLSPWLVAGLTPPLACLIAVSRLVFPLPPLTAPQGLHILPFSGLLALGLAVLMGLVRANRHRWRAVFRANRGRVIGALVLAFLTPVVVVQWFPWILGGFLLPLAVAALASGAVGTSAFLVGVYLTASALWFPVSCLIVTGIHGRAMRVAVFALVFWATYSAVLLIMGNQTEAF